jgi:hypothetical protein
MLATDRRAPDVTAPKTSHGAGAAGAGDGVLTEPVSVSEPVPVRSAIRV